MHTTHLESRVEATLLEVFRCRAQGVHEIPAHSRIALHLAGEHRLNVRQDAVEHLGDGLQGTFEDLEVVDGVGDGGVGGGCGRGEEVNFYMGSTLAQVYEEIVHARPFRSESLKRSAQGIGTNTQFSGLGKTPTGDLRRDGL